MRKRLNKREVERLAAIQDKLSKIWNELEENDVMLSCGNGKASEQVSCAVASLECILQEY